MDNQSLGIVVAMPIEASTLHKRSLFATRNQIIALSPKVTMIISGVGADNASRATKQLLDNGTNLIVSWGCAVGLNPNLNPGTLIMPETIIDQFNNRIETHFAWRTALAEKISAQQPIINGLHFHTENILSCVHEKRKIFETTQAHSADMESKAIGEVAAAHARPFVVIRSIADPAHFTMPNALLKSIEHSAVPNYKTLIKHLIFNPRELYQLNHLRLHYKKSADSLRNARFAMNIDDFHLHDGWEKAA